MTRPRSILISPEETPYYHIVSRCVRRTFLCGIDRQTGKNYQHRRQWIEDRLRILSSLFAIDLCSYAIMENHFHIVVKLRPEQSESWSKNEVLKRWGSLYKGPATLQKWRNGESTSANEESQLEALTDVYRERLTSLSWFMKCLNEPIARQANKEEGCTGHFWESRFKSQALLTEEALLSCMIYVDLNPIRAGTAETPETSNHTSIKERLYPAFKKQRAVEDQISSHSLRHFESAIKPLAKFASCHCDIAQTGVPFGLQDYLEIIDYTSRLIHPGKRGATPIHIPVILDRLNQTKPGWLEKSTQFELMYQAKFRRRTKRSAA